MTTPITAPNYPDPGKDRFWHGVHNPNNVKTPLIIELRESSLELNGDREPRAKFSVLIAKQPTIADPKAIREAMEDILTRAARVMEFTGILTAAESKRGRKAA